MTTVHLAYGGFSGTIKRALQEEPAPSMLVSFVYWPEFNRMGEVKLREWVLDSGAYTAFMSGKPIVLQDYIDFCKWVLDSDNPPTEIFGLDVIGDWKGTLKNCEEMWKQGLEVIPTFHAGEPDSVLLGIAKDYPKIAVGGAAGRLFGEERDTFLKQCFARVWPKRIHGFGVCTEAILMQLPFESVDATNWEIGPLRFGTWKSYDRKISIRKNHYLRPEVKKYLDLENKLKAKWKNELKKLM